MSNLAVLISRLFAQLIPRWWVIFDLILSGTHINVTNSRTYFEIILHKAEFVGKASMDICHHDHYTMLVNRNSRQECGVVYIFHQDNHTILYSKYFCGKKQNVLYKNGSLFNIGYTSMFVEFLH